MYRAFSPGVRRSSAAIALALGIGLCLTELHAQIPGRNVNMVSGTTLPDGDPYLQRQNEPSVAASTRNPLHLLGGANDYRTVDLPGLPGAQETGDAWLGVFKSSDGGQRWKSSLIPGYPQDQSPLGLASPLKGYQAGADPVVRAGVSGLFFYAGLAFDRGTNGKSAIFVGRFVDKNNRENGDPIAYLGTTIVASNPGVRFLDKPWMAVDIPRPGGGTCSIPGATQPIAAGTVYVSWTSVTGTGASLRSQILLSRSTNCGVTWSAPIVLSRPADQINQGSTIAIDPSSGAVVVAWRRFAAPASATDTDAIMLARSATFGRRFDPPSEAHRFRKDKDRGRRLPTWVFEHRGRDHDLDGDDDDFPWGQRPKFKGARQISAVEAFDQGSAGDRFRTNGYPAVAIDDRGRVYVAWTERGYSTLRPSPVDGDAKIVMTTSANCVSWTLPSAVTEAGVPGHQFMPSLAFAGGKLLLVYYDLRDDVSQSFAEYADDTSARPSGKRRTMDIRASLGAPGVAPAFAASVKVSDYPRGSRGGSSAIEQLQFNPPNLPMFATGTTPFVGDYIDLTPAPAFVPDGHGGWRFNTAGGTTLPVFHAVWTDNRDVRAPADGDWSHYTPPLSAIRPGAVCDPGFVASRNQNIYTARITGGLIVGSPANSKPLTTTFQRAFVVFAQNTTDLVKTFRMTIVSQPPGGHASFDQFTPPTQPLTVIDVTTAPRSLSARTVYATSSNALATIQVNVQEVTGVGGSVVSNGLQGTAYLNPDITNPDITNPDITNPDITNPDITNAEVYNPDITNPDITNPDITNPDITNPDITNPDITNPDITNPDITNTVVLNPDITNPDITNPDITNPDITNPDITNPDITNPDITNGAISDVTWAMQNNGNTTTAYNVNLFLAQQNVAGLKYQLILHKAYNTPVAIGCDLKLQQSRVLVANIPNPQFVTPTSGSFVDQNDPSLTNPTLWLAPGEAGFITLRVINPEKTGSTVLVNGVPVDSAIASAISNVLTPVVVPQPVGTPEVILGETQPPVFVPGGSTILFLQQPASTNAGQAIAPAVAVQVRNSFGAVVPGAQVTLTLGHNPGGATLTGGGATTANPNGIATFAGLTLDRLGSGYTLVASVSTGGITPATSAPFDVNGIVIRVPGNAGGTENINEPGGPAAAKGAVPVNTGVFVAAGRSVTVSASGLIDIGGGATIPPSGVPQPSLPSFLDTETNMMALVARFGPGTPWTYVGSGPTTLVAPASGFLELAVNDDYFGDNNPLFAWRAIVRPPASTAQVVTNTNASGPGSLAAAVAASSSGSGPQGIAFNIPGSGPFVIPAPALALANPTYIDGSTQPGYAGAPIIVLDGSTPAASWNGIDVAAPESTVRALVVGHYAGRSAINITAGNAHVYGSSIGLDVTGVTSMPNDNGIVVTAPGAVIGGALPSQRNAIAGNIVGISLRDGTSATTISGNTIGVPGAHNTAAGIEMTSDTDASPSNGAHVTGNAIQFTDGPAILMTGFAFSNTVRQNVIVDNLGAGIVLASGANNNQPAPALSSAISAPASTVISYSVPGGGAPYLVDFYTAPACGQARTWLGSQVAASSSPATFTTVPLAPETIVTATATDVAGNTSPFSCVTTTTAPPPPSELVRFVQQPTSTAAGEPVSVSVQVLDPTNAPIPGVAVTLTLGSNPGGATLSNGGPALTNADGNASFPNVIISAAAAGYTIVATVAGGQASAASQSFDITPPTPVITSVAPTQIAAGGQLITIVGTNLPGTTASDVVFQQGPLSEPAQYIWTAGPNLVLARLNSPRGGSRLTTGPVTVRIKNAADTVSSVPYGFVVSTTPGTPSILKVTAQSCSTGGGFAPLAGVSSGQTIGIQADGVDTAGSTIRVTHSVDGALGTFDVQCATAGDTGRPLLTFTLPTLNPGTITIELRHSVLGVPSAWSAPVTLTTPPTPVYLGPLGGNGGIATNTFPCARGTYATGFRVANGPGLQYALTSVQMLCSDGTALVKIGGSTTPDTDVACNPGDAMVGLIGDSGYAFGGTNPPVVTSIGARCLPSGGGSVYQTRTLPGGGLSFTADCPAGQAVVAFDGRHGAVVDAIRLTCGVP